MKQLETFERQDSILAHPKIPFRHVICAISTLCMTLLFSNIHVFNFTVLCMSEQADNSTAIAYNYTKQEKDLLLAAGYLGPFPAMIPLYYMVAKYGVSVSMAFCGFLSFFATLFSPLAAYYGFWPFMVMRLIQGVPAAITSPVMSVITSHWSTLEGNGVYVSILAAHYQLAPLLTMPLSAILCESFGWEWVYYTQAVLTGLAYLAFAVIHSDKPTHSRFVSRYELRKIEKGKSHEEKHVEKAQTPIKEICKTWSIWGVWLSSVGGTIGFSIFLQYGPTYLNQVLHYSLTTTGWSAALPYIFSCVARIFAQPLTANCEFLGEKLAAIVSTTISQGTMALSFIVLVFCPVEWSQVASVCYSLVIVANGLNGVGITRSAQLVSRQHLRFVYTVRGFANSTVGLFLPLLVNVMAPDNTHAQWTKLFIVIFVIVLSSNIFFILVADVKPAPWTMGTVEVDDRDSDEDIEKMEDKIRKLEGDEEEKY
ncbi:unnamed protein product [Auanema sp. JU1783]|nr:unnamed protein product [Auanema sp. JU1783]